MEKGQLKGNMKNIYKIMSFREKENREQLLTSHDTRYRKNQMKSSGGKVKTNKKEVVFLITYLTCGCLLTMGS